MSDAVALRGVAASDVKFIADAWCESGRKAGCPKGANPEPIVYQSGPSRKTLRPSSTDPLTYIAEEHALVGRIMARPTTRVLVACNPEDPDQIVGFVCFETPRTNTPRLTPRPIYHYCYIKELFRRRGIARQLVDASLSILAELTTPTEAWITHWSPHALALLKPLAVTYNEYVR